MQPKQKIIETYNQVAANYALQFMGELGHKPLDCLLLRTFYEENKNKGRIIDLGCGPGQITKFLTDCGCTDIIGTDISPEMIATAKKMNPQIHFEVADMLDLQYNDNEFGAAVAFYAIVHFDNLAIAAVFAEIKRVLKPGGQFLFSFHTGDEIVHRDEFLGKKVDIDFYFLDADKIITLLKLNGFNVIDALIRFPYNEEYPTKRAYIWAEKAS